MTAAATTRRRPAALWLLGGLGALLIVGVVQVIVSRDEPAPVLVWSRDLELEGFPPSGPMAPVPDHIDVALDPETGCFIELRDASPAIIVWPPGTTPGDDDATVVSVGGRAITAPTVESPSDVVRVPARVLGDQIEDLDRCVAEDTTTVALVMGLDL